MGRGKEPSQIEQAKEVSIVNYLKDSGIDVKRRGHKHWCSSPFSSDSQWSFAIYPNNTFYDWANGRGGDIIDLVQSLEHVNFSEAVDRLLGASYGQFTPLPPPPKREFHFESYVGPNTDEIRKYAADRQIRNYVPGKWMIKRGSVYIPVPSILFPHKDENHRIIGAKFRTSEYAKKRLIKQLEDVYIPKFNSRGELGWYILEHRVDSFKKPALYVMESETSAVSLYQYYQEVKQPVVILCFGGVNNELRPIPKEYQDLERYLIIDYDGDEEKFRERVDRISLDAEPLRLVLPKGEDLNSLYCKGEMFKASRFLK